MTVLWLAYPDIFARTRTNLQSSCLNLTSSWLNLTNPANEGNKYLPIRGTVGWVILSATEGKKIGALGALPFCGRALNASSWKKLQLGAEKFPWRHFFFFFFFLGEQMNERFERPASVVVTTMFIVAWKQRSWSYMTLPTITTMIWTRNRRPRGKFMQHLRVRVRCFLVLLPRNNNKKTPFFFVFSKAPKKGKVERFCLIGS